MQRQESEPGPVPGQVRSIKPFSSMLSEKLPLLPEDGSALCAAARKKTGSFAVDMERGKLHEK